MRIKHKYTGKEISGTYHYWKNNILENHLEDNYEILSKPDLVDVFEINITNGAKTFIETIDYQIAKETYLEKSDIYTIKDTDLSKFDKLFRPIRSFGDSLKKMLEEINSNGTTIVTKDTSANDDEKVKKLESLGYLEKINPFEFKLSKKGLENITTYTSDTMAKLEASNSTKLAITKEVFKDNIAKRIAIGTDILKLDINTISTIENGWQQFSAWDDYNSELLKQSFNKEINEYKKKYDSVNQLFGLADGPQNEQQKFIGKLTNKINNLKHLHAKIDLMKVDNSILELKHQIMPQTMQSDKIFIVHGHDETAKIKTARFIEQLGFKPIILHEQASSGKTIIEKIEEYSNVGFGIVLYTPCDNGGKIGDEENYKARARQNVVFEHGYLIGKIGRKNVCALVKGEIETPNDISGVVYISMDDNNAWHIAIARELKKAGYEIDMNKLV